MNNERVLEILRKLKKEYTINKPFLNFKTDFQLLVAVILSAQCTDARVNLVTTKLFRKVKHPKDIIKLSQKQLEKYVYSTGFYKNKSKNIKATAGILQNNFNGKVPSTMEKLLTLKGVSRKTANVVLGYLFNKKDAFPVDTHIKRLANRLNLTRSRNPAIIEKDLIKVTPKDKEFLFSTLLIVHGRKICKARSPQCKSCVISSLCPSAFTFEKSL
ncbi:endonuclease III [Candidatus Woesearchaeota archaeon]|nr:endonuclease III [Candidatus Woesearchaeota archaeon]